MEWLVKDGPLDVQDIFSLNMTCLGLGSSGSVTFSFHRNCPTHCFRNYQQLLQIMWATFKDPPEIEGLM